LGGGAAAVVVDEDERLLGGVARARIADERCVRREAMSCGVLAVKVSCAGWMGWSESRGAEKGSYVVYFGQLLDALGRSEGLVNVNRCVAVIRGGRLW
jgi:hypothetical protein